MSVKKIRKRKSDELSEIAARKKHSLHETPKKGNTHSRSRNNEKRGLKRGRREAHVGVDNAESCVSGINKKMRQTEH